MSTSALIWLHEYALSPPTAEINRLQLGGYRFIHVWDDTHLQEKAYSLKRLAFIYQSLIEQPIDIIGGATFEVLNAQPEDALYIPETADPFIHDIAMRLASAGKTVTWLTAPPFATQRSDKTIHRFFQYWKKIERSALMTDGGRE